ncbi:MAG TPA: hypothetical protein VIM02_05560 [Rhizomicrobium sp.]|jgi:hypothetical protein
MDDLAQSRETRARLLPTGTELPVAILVALISFGAGIGSFIIFSPQAWQWDSPAARTCLVLAVLCAGAAAMSLIVARRHAAEARRTRTDINDTRLYAKALLARTQSSTSAASEPKAH